MKRIALLALPLLCLVAPVAVADGYFGVQHVRVDVEEAGFSSQPTALVGRVGGFVGKNFAIEGRFGLGLESDSIDGYSSYEYEIDNVFGVYGRLAVREGGFRPYFLFGFTRGEASVSGGFDSEAESGTSFGVGADVMFNERVGLNLEFLKAIDKDDLLVETLSVGLTFTY